MFCDYTAGLVSGFVSVLIGHPLDTIKIQQQVRSLGFAEATKRIQLHRGWRGFYRGLAAPLVATGALNAIFFGIYGDLRDFLIERRLYSLDYNSLLSFETLNKENANKLNQKEIDQAKFSELFISGSIAGTVTILISAPIELVKTKLQSQMKRKLFTGPVHCMLTIRRESGIRGLFRGFVPLLFRDGLPGGGAYFIAYEIVKGLVRYVSGSTNEMTESVIAGGCAGMTNWALVLPFDTIKTRMQADDHKNPQYRGMLHTGREILKKDGIIGLYRGFWSVSIRAFPVNASIFLVYEYLQNKLCQRNKELNSSETKDK